jgi:methylthioribose-1-phosphate isomerase
VKRKERSMLKVIEYRDGNLVILDQRLLPSEEKYIICTTVEEVRDAIRELAVRGAPLIAIAAAYGVCVGLHQYKDPSKLDYIISTLKSARPTAYNIFLILDRIKEKLRNIKDFDVLVSLAEDEARRVHDEDKELCDSIAENGQKVIPDGAKIITYCNTGMLATGGIGTALGVIYKAFWKGKLERVYACETRPLLQGARLTAYELSKNGVPVKLISDNMISYLFSKERIDLAIVGADRIVRNGDVANKIGTYNLAVVCKHFGIPFYVAAPYTTIDLSLEKGEDIPIEERSDKEIKFIYGKQISPLNVDVWNPAFDVTPSELITGIITDKGIFRPDEIKYLYGK